MWIFKTGQSMFIQLYIHIIEYICIDINSHMYMNICYRLSIEYRYSIQNSWYNLAAAVYSILMLFQIIAEGNL